MIAADGARGRTSREQAEVRSDGLGASISRDSRSDSALQLTSLSPDLYPGTSRYEAQVDALRPVQARGALNGPDVHGVAARGVAGSGGALPHLDSIQAAFGRFDVGNVQAHVGGAAGEACGALGASAYASGGSVGFASAPDLHTAAHEAAHVVQQRGGVQLKGGVGQAGDRYERHADAVADAVVAGESAEALLAPYAGGGGGAAGVQFMFNGLDLFADEDDSDYEPPEPLLTKDKPPQINPKHWLADQCPALVKALDGMLRDLTDLGRVVANYVDLDENLAGVLEAALNKEKFKDDDGASELFYEGVAGTKGALAYFAQREKIADRFHDPRIPVVEVVGKDKDEHYQLHKDHWLCQGGFKDLVGVLNAGLVRHGAEMVEALRYLDAAKGKGLGTELARCLDYLCKGEDPSSHIVDRAHSAWVRLGSGGQAEMRRLWHATGLDKYLDPGLALDFVVNGLPKAEEPVYKARPPKKVFEEALEGHWLNKDEIDMLCEVMGRRSAAGFIDHEIEKGRMGHLRGMIEQLGRTHGRLSQADDNEPPLSATSLVVDSNVASLLLADPKQLGKDEALTRARLVKLIGEKGYTDIRLANLNVLEMYQEGGGILDDPKKDKRVKDVPPFYGLPINVRRTSPEYNAFLERMERDRVGQNKGAADRSMMADLFFAKTAKKGEAVSFMTIDKACVKPLMRWAGHDPDKAGPSKNWKELIASASKGKHKDGTFEVEGHKSGPASVSIVPVEFGPLDSGVDKEPSKEPVKESSSNDKSGEKVKEPKHKDALLDAPAGDKHTVRDFMAFIEKLGYEVYIVGGAIRDEVQKKQPNDIDLATSLDYQTLYEALRKDPGFSHEFVQVTPEIHLVQVGKGGNQLDIACNKAADKADKTKMDLAADAAERDFTMNALYMGLDRKIVDPTGRGAKDAAEQRAHYVTEVKDLAKDLEDRPLHLARLIKFAIRGYQIDKATLEAVRPIAAKIIGGLAPRDKELFFNRTTAKTPKQIVDAMEQMGFPTGAIEALLPDQLRGTYGDGQKVYSRDLDVDRLPELDKEEWKTLKPSGKTDTRNKRPYQERVPVVAAGTDEELVIDIDHTDHALPGHRAPHYHIYRKIKGSWDKNAAGLSHTGQPGLPAIAKGVYNGPKPWTWVPEDLPMDLGELETALDNVFPGKVTRTEELFDIDGQVVVHVDKVRELAASGQLATLMLMARNVQDKATEPGDKDDAWTVLTRSPKRKLPGERLRFTGHLQQVGPFLEACNAPKAINPVKCTLDEQLRLYDLVASYGNEKVKTLQEAAAAASKKYAGVHDWVERFELFLATGEAEVDKVEGHEDLEVSKAKIVRGKALAQSREAIQKAADQLAFRSLPAAAYHHAKHAGEIQSKDKGFKAYLAEAREVITKAEEVKSSIEQTGSENHIFFMGYRKAIVRVLSDGSAYIATYYSERDAEEEEERSDKDQPKDGGVDLARLTEQLVRALIELQTRPNTRTGSRNQFQVAGARRACSAIAVLAIEHFVANGVAPSQQDIDQMLTGGADIYRSLQDGQNDQVALMRALALSMGADMDEVNRQLDPIGGETYYAPNDADEHVQGVDYVGGDTVHGGDVKAALARAVGMLVMRQRAGVAIVVGQYTVSITRNGNHFFYFDSHGDAMEGRAFTLRVPLNQTRLLIDRAYEGLKTRMRKGEGPQHDIGLSLFVPHV